MWRQSLEALAMTADDGFYGPLTPADLTNGVLQLGNFVVTGEDLVSTAHPAGTPMLQRMRPAAPHTVFEANKLYQIVRFDNSRGAGGFVLKTDSGLWLVFFSNEEQGWADKFFKATAVHPQVNVPPTFQHNGGPSDLAADILQLLNLTHKGAPTPLPQIFQEEFATFSPTAPADIEAFRASIGQALVYLQNTNKIIINPADKLVYLTREGRQ